MADPFKIRRCHPKIYSSNNNGGRVEGSPAGRLAYGGVKGEDTI